MRIGERGKKVVNIRKITKRKRICKRKRENEKERKQINNGRERWDLKEQ